MAAAMRAVRGAEPETKTASPKTALELVASVVCAVAGLAALVVGVDGLFGGYWALLAVAPFLLYAAFVFAPDN